MRKVVCTSCSREKNLYIKRAISLLLVFVLFALLVSQGACSSFPNKTTDDPGPEPEVISEIAAPRDSAEFEGILNNVTAQNIAAFVNELKANVDFEAMLGKLEPISATQKAQLLAEDLKIERIVEQFNDAKTFLDDPSHIIGNPQTKYGEGVERADVAAHNFDRISKGLKPDAEFNSVKRTAAYDYTIAGKQVQSKFNPTPQRTLYEVLRHNDDYSYFGKDGKSYYRVPKDQFDIYRQVNRAANPTELDLSYNNSRLGPGTLENIKRDIQELERRTGRSFNDIVKPSKFTFKQAQRSLVASLGLFKDGEIQAREANKTSIKQGSAVSRNAIIAQYIKNDFIKSAGKASAIGLSIAAIVSAGFVMYEKVEDGKSIENFTGEDWKDVGIAALTGGAEGAGIAAGTLLLCVFGIPAPFAVAIVVTIFQTMVLYNSYSKGNISFDEFLTGSLDAASTSSIIMAGAIIGQMVIPIPLVGLIIGSVATGILLLVAKTYAPTIDKIEEKVQEYVDDFSVRLNELLDSASDSIGETVDATKTTLVTAYTSTKSYVSDASAFAIGKVKTTFGDSGDKNTDDGKKSFLDSIPFLRNLR